MSLAAPEREETESVPETWFEKGLKAREEFREGLDERDPFRVGVDLRVKWAEDQSKDQDLLPVITACREKDREALQYFQIGDGRRK